MDEGTKLRLSQEQMNTAMKSLPHMLQWLDKSGRRWFVLNGPELVEALWKFDEQMKPPPGQGAVETFMQCLMLYREHRARIDSGETKTEKNVAGDLVEVPVMKPETLTIVELDRCIRYLNHLASSIDPSWSLQNPAL